MSREPATAELPAGFGPVVLGRKSTDGVFDSPVKGVYTAPRDGTVVVVTAVGGAEGSRGAAAALACAGSGVEGAALLVDVGGRVPRPTLIASAAAHRLEERLAARLPALRPAARGEVCHLAVAADEDGLAAAGIAITVARGGLSVVHVTPELLQPLLAAPGARRLDAALLRADLEEARPLVALAVDDLLRRGLRVAVLKHRLGWVAERRAGFGALGSDSGGLPESLLRRLLDLGPTRG
ncbi:MAG TPA: hypothetical protein VHA80_06565 [Solirubrobacterales bacterium]|jgi:hypothetical protein|nr:hypothetical protein [Solirubrobacterales bacterium]